MALAAERERLESALGESSALKAELHGLALEKNAAHDEASRQRQRTEEAESRLQEATGQLHALRLEHTDATAKARLPVLTVPQAAAASPNRRPHCSPTPRPR